MAAAAYQIMAFGEAENIDDNDQKPHSRKLSYVKTFLRLVRANHRKERSIGFYADKMFISPKSAALLGQKRAASGLRAEFHQPVVVRQIFQAPHGHVAHRVPEELTGLGRWGYR